MLKEKINEYCDSLGLDTIGFIKCRRFDELIDFYSYRKENGLENEFEESDIEKRINPNWYMKEGKAIISIAFPYLWFENNIDNGFSRYTKGLDYHRVVKSYLDKICIFINELGGEAVSFVDSNTLPERYIAYLAGIGFIGKNNMIITEKYGSYVFLGEIITNLDLSKEDVRKFEEIKEYKECGKCTNCYKECPTKSINVNRINPNICSSYITQKKELSDIDMKLLKGKIFGCDICQNTCPYNNNINYSNIEEFKPLNFMCNLEVEVYAEINNKFFKENISKTSCGWRGKNVIRRNAIIKLHNEGKDIKKYNGDSPYLNEYIQRLK
ncbi:tRNA epoxyqueuosine(34) reductase QueG [Clostridioides difficile]